MLIMSCSSAEEEELNCSEEKYDESFNAVLGDVVCFPDGNSFEIKTITDQFCCCQCVCIWEGELQVMIETTHQDGSKDLFNFGSASYDSEIAKEVFPGYIIRDFNFLYNGLADVLPLCDEEYDAQKVDLFITVSPI